MSRAGQAPEKNSKSEAAVPHESPQSQQIASPSTGKVMGTVFYDVDGDGRLGPGDQGVKNVGVTARALSCSGRPSSARLTRRDVKRAASSSDAARVFRSM